MPLVSQGGGRVRTSPLTSYTPGHAPTSLGIRRPRSVAGATKTVSPNVGRAGRLGAVQPSTIRATAARVVTKGKGRGAGAGAAATGGGGVQDPFKFIQGLLSNMDPAKAQALVDQIYAPLRQQINDQIAQSQGLALARANQMKDVYGAFAQYMGGLSGNLQSIYQAGRSDGNALASGMAGPGGDVAAHLDTMAGIQNTMLGAEAKGWGDFGASMPGVYSLMATQNVKNMLNAATADQATLRSKLLELSSQEASDVLKYLNDAQAKDVQLKEWAYGQSQSQQSAKAAAVQNQLNYDLKVAQFKMQNYQLALARGDKLAAQQALNEYRAAEQQYKYDALNAQNTRSAASIAAENKRSAASIAAQNKRSQAAIDAANARAAKSLQFRRQQAMQKAGQLKPAPDAVSRSAGTMQLWNPAAKTYVTAVDQNGKPIKYKAGAGPKGSTSSKTPGSPAYIADLQKQRADFQGKIGKAAQEKAKKYYIHAGGGTGTSLTRQQKAQIKAELYDQFHADLERVARQLQLYGKLNRKQTPRNFAEYWINTATRTLLG